MADARSSEEATNIHGLFGAVIVEPPEYSEFFHDELEILDKDGNPPMDHRTGLPSSTTAISYRSEPMRNRMPLTHDPADSGEDISMSSWVYGDPAPPILRAYVGDPSKIRLIHGGVKETHVFHLHNHQWRLEPENPVSTIIDSITISPQECYTLDILFGAGSKNGVIGDVIFHCHLYPHFHEGMWTLWRIHDRLEDGSGTLPDGTPVPPLQPPCGVLDVEGNPTECPSRLEQANFVEHAAPGALYTETCPCHIMNAGGSCEPCETETEEGETCCGDPSCPDCDLPGDCIELCMTNLLPEFLEENTFQLRTRTDIVGHHVHLVKFDTITSDGAANGWNNIAGARKYETLVERFFADEELRTVFFHDHLFANAHQLHGMFGVLIIEEAGATFHDIRNDEELPVREITCITPAALPGMWNPECGESSG